MQTVFFDDEADILDLRYDIAFKAVFAKDSPQSRKALAGLVSACIGRKVSVIALAANEPAPVSARSKQIRYDIACRFESGELADVEMTLHPAPDEPFREEYFAARHFISQDILGSEYSELKNTYQINILAKGIRWQDDDIVHYFRFHDAKHALSFNGKMHIITVELLKAGKIAREKSVAEMGPEEAWAVFLHYHTEKGKRALVNEILREREDIAMAGETALSFSKEELEWYRNESKLKYELDEQSRLAREKRERREALEKGLAKGREKGLVEGRVEGVALANRESARKMKEAGLSADQIKMFTGLSPEEIENL